MLENLKPPPNNLYTCKVNLIQETLQEPDKKIFLAAIADSEIWKAKALANSLRQLGVSISDTTIGRHRSQMCNCFRK